MIKINRHQDSMNENCLTFEIFGKQRNQFQSSLEFFSSKLVMETEKV